MSGGPALRRLPDGTERLVGIYVGTIRRQAFGLGRRLYVIHPVPCHIDASSDDSSQLPQVEAAG